MAALEGARQRLEADVVGAAVAGEDHDRDVLVLRQRVAPAKRALRGLDAAATAAAFSNATCIQGTFQAVVGNRVVATSRQPVALTTTTGPLERVQHRADDRGDPAALAERVPAAQRWQAVLVADEGLQAGHGSPLSPT